MFVMMRLDNVFKIQTSFDFPLGDLISLLGAYWVLNRYRKREEGGEGEKKIPRKATSKSHMQIEDFIKK